MEQKGHGRCMGIILLIFQIFSHRFGSMCGTHDLTIVVWSKREIFGPESDWESKKTQRSHGAG